MYQQINYKNTSTDKINNREVYIKLFTVVTYDEHIIMPIRLIIKKTGEQL